MSGVIDKLEWRSIEDVVFKSLPAARQGGRAMAEVMQTDRRHPSREGQPLALFGDPVRLEFCAVLPGEDAAALARPRGPRQPRQTGK
ncbi:hypothetical protein [Nonomuraea sp. NPDC048826]|uniref:hypothetical protein n=1 Tax=Nonomuraea sp. NPDC048826 TaxID=3364347 RepID=UPI003724470A